MAKQSEIAYPGDPNKMLQECFR
jgi:hypothetical protein